MVLPYTTSSNRSTGAAIVDDTPSTVIQLIEAQCERTPDRIAVVCGNEKLTYEDLRRRSNGLARLLLERGVRPKSIVAICVERSTAMLVALLGILKSGAAYVPIDPDYPQQRIRFMLEDCEAELLVTQESLATRCAHPGVESLHLDADRQNICHHDVRDPEVSISSEDLAYLMYTSGSTGTPKGVAIPHGALSNLLQSMAIEPGLDRSDVLLAVTTLSFDIAGLELYLPLTVGARVVVASAAITRDLSALQRLIDESGATAMQATPALWRMLIDSGWQGKPDLKILCGGEALARDLADALLQRGASLWNMYGPTETTIWSFVEQVQKNSGPITIGHPIANTEAYILDEQGEPVPTGVSGELYIGGAGLARGYWNRPELTGERFVSNRFGPPGSRLYRTGDEAKSIPDGRVECLGRKDDQVKIRGYRIELGEIEATLRTHPAVRNSTVVAHKSANDEPRLAAYVVPRDMNAPPGAQDLRNHLQTTLPEYMIPAFFVTLRQLPLTPNGKVDRRALPEPLEARSCEAEFLGPRSDIERKLASIFTKVLGVSVIGVRDSFFDLGGNSLLAVHLFSEISQVFGIGLPLITVFQAQTVELLSAVLASDSSPASWSPLVAMQTRGNLPPFFCVHSQGSSVLGYGPLAEALGPDQPFYALQPRGLDGKSRPHERIEDMAADYIKEIRKIDPDGPYYLGGICLGGVIALEMAHQLREQEREVAFVALIDTHFPGQPKHLPQVSLRSPLLWRLDRELGLLLRLSNKQRVSQLCRRARNLIRGRRKSNLPEPLTKVVQANARAESIYVPKPYDGRLFLFWCSEWSFRAFQDRRLSWSEIASEGLEVHVVPGNHETMRQPPHVDVLAQKLTNCLRRSRNV